MKIKNLILILFVIFIFTACVKKNYEKKNVNKERETDLCSEVILSEDKDSNIDSSEKKQDQILNNNVEEISRPILEAISKKNYSKLCEYISEDKGLRLSYTSIFNPKFDILLTKDELINNKDLSFDIYFGNYNESFNMSLDEVFDFFAVDLKLFEECKINTFYENDKICRNSDVLNIRKYFPYSDFIDCYFKPSGECGDMDWCSIMLVLEKENGGYRLVGLAIDQIEF